MKDYFFHIKQNFFNDCRVPNNNRKLALKQKKYVLKNVLLMFQKLGLHMLLLVQRLCSAVWWWWRGMLPMTCHHSHDISMAWSVSGVAVLSRLSFVFLDFFFLWRGRLFFNPSHLRMWLISKERQKQSSHFDLTAKAINVATTATRMTLSTLATIAPVKKREKHNVKMFFKPKVWILFVIEWLENNMFTDQHSYLARLLQVPGLLHLDHLKHVNMFKTHQKKLTFLWSQSKTQFQYLSSQFTYFILGTIAVKRVVCTYCARPV